MFPFEASLSRQICDQRVIVDSFVAEEFAFVLVNPVPFIMAEASAEPAAPIITASSIAAAFTFSGNRRGLFSANDADENAPTRHVAKEINSDDEGGDWWSGDDDDFDEDEDGTSYDDGGLRQQRDVAVALQASLDLAPGVPVLDGALPRAVASKAAGHSISHGSNKQPVSKSLAMSQPREHVLDRYSDRIDLTLIEAREATGTTRHTGRDDRATVEQVLDPRTRMILFKMLSAGMIGSIHGCISTGKEANVYHAFTPTGGELAIKVYKTSILVFKDRDRYVSGEFRFKSGYAKSNPRKMVKLWAEKEMRNLKRLGAAGIPVPSPTLLRMHVLVMDFIGKDGVAAPRLKDAGLSQSKATAAYREVVTLMRRMFRECRLVHADLSEYNMLYHAGHVMLIDVSQSVESDHPRALEFLRMDATNVTDYFRRCGVTVMTPRELFDFVVGLEELDALAAQDAFVGAALARSEARGNARPTGEEEVAEGVFMAAFIPQSLAAVRDVEGDVDKLTRGETGELYYGALTGMTSAAAARAEGRAGEEFSSASEGALGGAADGEAGDCAAGTPSSRRGDASRAVRFSGDKESDASAAVQGGDAPSELQDDDAGDDGSDDSDDDSDSEEDDGEGGEPAYTKRAATKEEKAAHKAAVKAAKREKRKSKIPKATKKKHAKATAGKK